MCRDPVRRSALLGGNEAGQAAAGGLSSISRPVVVSGLESGVSALTAGFRRTCAVKQEGLCCYGYLFDTGSPAGLVLQPTVVAGRETGVVTASAGRFSTCALMTDRQVHCFGENLLAVWGMATWVSVWCQRMCWVSPMLHALRSRAMHPARCCRMPQSAAGGFMRACSSEREVRIGFIRLRRKLRRFPNLCLPWPQIRGRMRP